MRTLDRYITGTYLKNLFFAVLALTALFMFQSLLTELFDHNYPTSQILFYNLLNLPQVMVQMTPPAVLLATVFTLSGMSRTNELTACYSLGIGLQRIVTLLISVVFIFSCLILVMEDRFLPMFFKKRTTYYWQEMQKKPDFFLDIKRDKIWYRSKNLIYNLQRFDVNSKTIIGMDVYTFDDDFNMVQVVSAEKAEFMATGWKLENGTVTVFTPGSPFPMTKAFKEKELPIAESPKDFQEIEKEVDGLRLKDLRKYINQTRAAGADTKNYEVKFHSRISLSFIPLVMAILGVPFSTRGRREGGAAKDLGLCLGLTFFYWLFYSVGLSLGNNGALPPILAAWLPSLVFAGMAAFLISRQRQ